MKRIQSHAVQMGVDCRAADPQLIEFKEALIMALMGVLRYREEDNVLCSVTGASRNSVGGALWKTN